MIYHNMYGIFSIKKIRYIIILFCVSILIMGNIMSVHAATLTHNDRYAGCGMEYGIDVSYHQGDIDWEKVKQSGVRFAFIRVARRTLDGGTLGMDTRAIENIEGAISVGLPIGVYIFTQAVSQAEALEEADYIIKAIEPYKDDIKLPVVFDFEYADIQGNSGRLENANLSRNSATNICLVFCNKVKEAGYTPMIYANRDILSHDLDASVIARYYPIWLAHYTYETDYEGQYTYWQYSSNGKVDGIDGRVDLNVRYLDSDDEAYGEVGKELQEYQEFFYEQKEPFPTWVFWLIGGAAALVVVMIGSVIGLAIKEGNKNGN